MGVCRVPGRSYLLVTVTVIAPIFPPGCVGNRARFTSLLQARIVCFPPSTWVSRWRPSAEFGIQTAALALHGAANEQNRTLHMHEKLISTRFFTLHHSTCPGASLLSRAPVDPHLIGAPEFPLWERYTLGKAKALTYFLPCPWRICTWLFTHNIWIVLTPLNSLSQFNKRVNYPLKWCINQLCIHPRGPSSESEGQIHNQVRRICSQGIYWIQHTRCYFYLLG